MRPLISLDIETTGLDPLRHEILEAALVFENAEYIHFSLPITRSTADEKALEINRYHERKDALDEIQIAKMSAVEIFMEVLTGALVVGNNVQFDLRFVEQLIQAAPWYYAPLDLKAWVAGRCGMNHPASTATIADVSGVALPEDQHTALSDAQWNMSVYRALSR